MQLQVLPTQGATQAGAYMLCRKITLIGAVAAVFLAPVVTPVVPFPFSASTAAATCIATGARADA